MVVNVEFTGGCILLLNSHKWYVDSRYLANVMRMPCEEFQEAMDALKNGGQGTRTDGSFKSNPKPYDQKISFSESVDNILNLHEANFGNKKCSLSCSNISFRCRPA